MNETAYIVKIGGNIIDDEMKLSAFLQDFARVQGKKILIHGGGKLATRLADQLGIPQQLIDGRRVTDTETLRVVTMVYAGYINKNIVARLQSFGCNALGLCGADGNMIRAHKRNHPTIDYGYAGDIDSSQLAIGNWQLLLKNNFVPVIAPITHDGNGQLLNTNADTIAQEIAKGLSHIFDVHLLYSFERSGVLLDINDDSSVIDRMNFSYYQDLKNKHVIHAGMIPKLDNAFTAVQAGVKKVIIGKAENLIDLIEGKAGTSIVHD
jgi:acetylglutamate kinase